MAYISFITGPSLQRFGDRETFVGLPLSRGREAMSPNDVEYYRARATEEREQALSANQRNVAEIHMELARLYDALVNEPAIRPTLSISVPKRASG